jgi:hypothetical protein
VGKTAIGCQDIIVGLDGICKTGKATGTENNTTAQESTPFFAYFSTKKIKGQPQKKQKPQAMPAASLKRGKMKKRKNQSVYFYLTGKM